jgi:large subunit ribosomal protein L6|tara:strand:+ start:204 stop:755 length:552 start_codon:yes stop_codon:yes gene_type:complete
MSRVGNSNIEIPEGVTLKFVNGLFIAKGKLGELSLNINQNINIEIGEQVISLTRKNDSNENKAMHGLTRALINNMVTGVTKGFTKKLELVGVGYRATNQGQLLDVSVGFSHNIVFEVPDSVKVTTETEKGKAPIITLTSINKQLLGHVAAKIRSFRKPEPYKGKGIRYVDEYVRKKAGKTAAS